MNSRPRRYPALILPVLLTFSLTAHAQDSAPEGASPPSSKGSAASDKPAGSMTRPVRDSSPAKTERPAVDRGRDTAEIKRDRTGERPDSTPVADASAPIVQEPSQGRPIFITAGETFILVMRMTDQVEGGSVRFFLRHAKESHVGIPLRPNTPPSYSGDYCTMQLLVPSGTEAGVYDLEIRPGSSSFFSRHSVKVVDEFKTHFRFVHLSNMNVGDPTAPEFDNNLPQEVNLLAPEFIIATGDYTEWARARDDASSWPRVLKYFEQFDAPVFLLCGQHDHEASFSSYVASKPIGTIDYGAYHGLLLLDHPGNPLDQDSSQIQWIETDLKRNKQKRMNFVAANSDELALIDIWREGGRLGQMVKDFKVKMMLVGGSCDWDYKEFADKLRGAGDLHYIRTHQASTALRDRATGISHFRVIDVDGDRISYVYPDDNAPEKLQYSIPTGRLRVFYEDPNDGSADHVAASILNGLNQGFQDARVWLRVAKGSSAAKPSVAPGRIVRILDAGAYWACEVSLDLPDKGAVRVMADRDPERIPPQLPIDVEVDGPRDWTFAPRTTDFGLTYFHSDAKVAIKLTNRAKSALTCWPTIRINGAQLHPDREACPRLPITLEPGKTMTVPLVLDVRRVSAGRHSLQISFLEDPLNRPQVFDVAMTQ